MSDWRAAVARVRGEFEEALLRSGFRMRESNNRLVGRVSTTLDGITIDHPVEIVLPPAFPYRPPKVLDTAGSGSGSWHQEMDGSLCLYAQDDDCIPWLDAARLLRRIEEWFHHDRQGWIGDPPDLDLQRYFFTEPGLILYENVSTLVGSPIRLERKNEGTFQVVGKGIPLKASRNVGTRKFGWAFDVGELARPFRTWDELADLLGATASKLGKEIRSGRGDIILVRYTQQGREGVVALSVGHRDGSFELKAVSSASQSIAIRRLRAGPDSETLQDKHVVLVGIGAVGSFSADLLARCGVGKLQLIDGDILRPGNCIRHLAGAEHIGRSKVNAVATIIHDRYSAWVDVRPLVCSITTLDDAERVFAEADLVMDLTGHFGTSTLLADAAEILGRPLVSAYLQRSGSIVRVDRWPIVRGKVRLDSVPPFSSTRERRLDLREAGCGDPVSPTSPSAVVYAAALACAVASDCLTGRYEYPDSMIRIHRPQEDAPYDIVSKLG